MNDASHEGFYLRRIDLPALLTSVAVTLIVLASVFTTLLVFAPTAHANVGIEIAGDDASAAHAYKRDLKDVEFHLIDTGHFALEEYGDVIAVEMLDFLDRKVARD